MELTLRGFRCFDSETFTFPEDGIIYIDADNGAGKSTIFHAIQWVLHGRLQHVGNWTTPSSKMWVRLVVGDEISIFRQRCPTLLKFEYLEEGIILELEAAQAEIVKTFGEQDTWLATSFNELNQFHPIMRLSAKARAKMLDNIAFDGQDPNCIIEKFVDKIKECEAKMGEIEKKRIKLVTEKKVVMRTNSPSTNAKLLTQEELICIQSSISDNKKCLRDTQQKYEQLVLQWTEHRNSSQRYTEILKKINNRSIEELSKRIEEVETSNKEYDRQQLIRTSVEKEEKVLSSYMNKRNARVTSKQWNDKELFHVRNVENMYVTNKDICSRLHVNYNKDEIDTHIYRIDQQLSSQWKFDKLDRRTKLEHDLSLLTRSMNSIDVGSSTSDELRMEREGLESSLSSKVEEMRRQAAQNLEHDCEEIRSRYSSQISEIRVRENEEQERTREEKEVIKSQLRKLESSRENITCPHCSGCVKLVDRKLIKVEEYKFDRDMYNVLRKKISNIENVHFKSAIPPLENKMRTELDERKRMDTCEISIRNLQREINMQISTVRRKEETLRKVESDRVLSNRIRDEIQSLNVDVQSIGSIHRLSSTEVQSQSRKLQALRKISFYEKPSLSYSEMREQNEQHNNGVEIGRCEQKLSALRSTLSYSNITRVDTRPLLVEFQSLSSLFSQLEHEKSVLQKYIASSPPSSPSSIKESITKLHTTIENLENDVEQSRRLSIVTNLNVKLAKIKKLLQEQYNRDRDFRAMKEIAIETQYNIHSKLIESLNSFIDVCTPLLFDDDMKIVISQVREVKGGERMIVHLRFFYKGAEFDDISCLSGGEQRRVSVIMSLAFNSRCGGKMMILDESIAPLSSSRRDALLKLIGRVMKGKLVLVTGQECHTGYFDEILSI